MQEIKDGPVQLEWAKSTQITDQFLLVGRSNTRYLSKKQIEGWAMAQYGLPVPPPVRPTPQLLSKIH